VVASADFFVAQAALSEASRYVSDLAGRRGLDEAVCMEALHSLLCIVQVVEDELLEQARDEAQARIRDPEDWPTLALSLQLECAVWTEDQVFFGTGVATWTCATVLRYLDA
jgi:predicted nucleic acid-binding protein